MADLNGFDANDHEPSGEWTPLPKGQYVAMAKSSDWKDTANGKGRYLQFDLEVIDGEYKGRQLVDRLNLQNDNAKAVQIANGTLSAICRAVGVMRPKDSSELHNKPMLVSVDVEKFTKNDGGEGLSNKIKAYKPVSATPAPSSGGTKPPWAK